MSELVLRPIDAADRPFLLAVYASTRAEEFAQVDDWHAGEEAAFVEQQFSAQHAHYQKRYAGARFLVVELDGRPAGRLYVDEWADEIRLVDISLLTEFRGTGLGTRLLTALQAEAARVGKPLRIHVEPANPALRLYERLGFRLLPDQDVFLFLEWRPPTD